MAAVHTIESRFVGQDDIYRNSGSKLSLRTNLELEVERFRLDTQTGINHRHIYQIGTLKLYLQRKLANNFF